jgi:hypothetical protein
LVGLVVAEKAATEILAAYFESDNLGNVIAWPHRNTVRDSDLHHL